MLVGHLAVGFAAKRAQPKLSLAALMFAVLLVDFAGLCDDARRRQRHPRRRARGGRLERDLLRAARRVGVLDEPRTNAGHAAAFLSFAIARASIWRTRSRESESRRAISASVCS